MFKFMCLIIIILVCVYFNTIDAKRKKVLDKNECPSVKAMRHFDLEKILGKWYVIEYYASSEEALSYRCMRADFTMFALYKDVTMNFTYSFTDDPINEQLVGNITWIIPNANEPAHWIHSENTYEGVYNTYVLDTDYTSWSLLLHCAEKAKVPRYLSSFIMSREPVLGYNVISYLRDKLPRYDIDMSYMFNMTQNDCNSTTVDDLLLQNVLISGNSQSDRRHPMKNVHL